MKPYGIHIGPLHRSRFPWFLFLRSSPPPFPMLSQKLEGSPRYLIDVTAMACVGLSPAFNMVETELTLAGEAFETTFTTNRVAFSQNGEEHGNASTVTKQGTYGYEPYLFFLRQTDRTPACPTT